MEELKDLLSPAAIANSLFEKIKEWCSRATHRRSGWPTIAEMVAGEYVDSLDPKTIMLTVAIYELYGYNIDGIWLSEDATTPLKVSSIVLAHEIADKIDGLFPTIEEQLGMTEEDEEEE